MKKSRDREEFEKRLKRKNNYSVHPVPAKKNANTPVPLQKLCQVLSEKFFPGVPHMCFVVL